MLNKMTLTIALLVSPIMLGNRTSSTNNRKPLANKSDMVKTTKKSGCFPLKFKKRRTMKFEHVVTEDDIKFLIKLLRAGGL